MEPSIFVTELEFEPGKCRMAMWRNHDVGPCGADPFPSEKENRDSRTGSGLEYDVPRSDTVQQKLSRRHVATESTCSRQTTSMK